ncbi:hypothetical protein IC757_05750 [Wenzhouxiangella sp. AB-CW3]|uniref:hypothetical protein n=1 Tax=Wenzhouxiangella sp. AB-CW3 TaxID=2771012 RepID=UPI00168B47B9|nr:hypothetical protein [Wenzhouxiangella sp. AB-CW3]QOC23642.1 hypothetical protein IC757_05750 [Wenzhouxiangella sp. AB-CW3]
MHRLIAVAAVLVLLPCSPAVLAENEPVVEWLGFAAVRAGWVEGQPGWIEGGFGRLAAGGDAPGDRELWVRGETQLGLRFEPSVSWRGKLHAVARASTADNQGDAVGLTEAWARYQRAVGHRGELALTGGLFFFPTSQENIDPLWASPYTLTYSAINSWFAEEFRPLGLDAEWQSYTGQGDIWSLGATVFGGNDTMGTLLAWRGWAMHDRLGGFDEKLPLPPVFSLEDGRYFGAQRHFSTTAFGSDLDGRPGWAARARFDRGQAFSGQVAWVDNRGDRRLHGDEWAWATRFAHAGGHWQVSDSVELMGEFTHGNTRIRFPGSPWVDADFRAAYLMASVATTTGRWSLRHDRFHVDDRLANPAWGLFNDRGRALTLAWIRDIADRSRFGVELLWLESDRSVAAQSGFPADTDGLSLLAEWRIKFH